MRNSSLNLKAPIFALLALLAATILPLIVGASFGLPVVNPIWGSVFGLGFWMWQQVFGMPTFGNAGGAYVLFGAVIWPIILTVAISIFIHRGYGIKPKFMTMFNIFFILTLCVILPEYMFNDWPIYMIYFR